MAKSTERIIKITVDASRAKDETEALKRKLKGIETQGKKTNKSLSSMVSSINIFRTAISALVVGTGISGIVKMADSYTNLNSRIKLVTDSTEEHTKVLNGLDAIASVTFSSLEANAQLYNRISTSMEHYNITAEQTLAITEGVAHTFRISGATAQESASGLIQFSQGLAAGRFQGDELRNILEGNISMQRIFAKAMGTTTAELKKLGAEGKITAAKVLPELIRNMEELRKQSAKVSPTISAGFQILTNKLTLFIGEINKATDVSKGFGRILEFIANNLEKLAVVLATVVSAALLGKLASGLSLVTTRLVAMGVAAKVSMAAMTVGISLAVVAIWELYDSMTVTALGIDLAFLKVQKTMKLFAFGLAALNNSTTKLFGGAFVSADRRDALDKDLKSKVAGLKALDEQILATEITLLKFQNLARNKKDGGLVSTTDLDFMKDLDKLTKAMGGTGKGLKVKTVKDPIGDRLKALQDELEMMGRITKESQIQGEIINMTRIRKEKATNDDLKDIAKQIDAKKRPHGFR